MTSKASESGISWGGTPLGRIASVSADVELLPLSDNLKRRRGSEPSALVNRLPYRKQSLPVAYRQVSESCGSAGRISLRKHSLPFVNRLMSELGEPASRFSLRKQSLPQINRSQAHVAQLKRHSTVPSSLTNLVEFDDADFLKKISVNIEDEVFKHESSTDDILQTILRSQEKKDEMRGRCPRIFSTLQYRVNTFIEEHKNRIKHVMFGTLFLLYLVYFGYAMYFSFGDEGSVRLLVCTVLGVLVILLNNVSDSAWLAISVICTWKDKPTVAKRVRWMFYALAVLAVIISLVVEVGISNPSHLLCLPGLLFFLLIAWITSTNPGQVHWHPVFWGLITQYFCGLVLLRMDWGEVAARYVEIRLNEFLHYAEAGSRYVFGDAFSEHPFAFMVLPVTVFFSTAVSVFYHLGVLQAITRVFGRTMSFCFHTSPIEAINLVGNIFIGFMESPLLIRPFLPEMTRSELHTVMTAGFATVAGNMIPLYAAYGIPVKYLIAASIMSVPATLAVSKLSCPETEETRSKFEHHIRLEERVTKNILEAISEGATRSVKLLASMVVTVIAFISVFDFLNATLVWFGNRVGLEDLSFEFVCMYLFYPIALFMGVEPSHCKAVARIIAVKIFTNELSGYSRLSQLSNNRHIFNNYTMGNNYTDWNYSGEDIILHGQNMTLIGGVLSEREEVIATFSLCGFSNIGTMGIMLGLLAALVPHKKLVVSRTIIRPFCAANLACFITACSAGLLFKE